MSGQGELGDAIQALRLGAWDYLYKPIEEMSFLQLTIERVMDKARLIKENQAYREHLEDLVKKRVLRSQPAKKGIERLRILPMTGNIGSHQMVISSISRLPASVFPGTQHSSIWKTLRFCMK